MDPWYFPLGLAVGLFVGNMLIYKFLHGWTWAAACGIGATAGVIGFILMLTLNYFTTK